MSESNNLNKCSTCLGTKDGSTIEGLCRCNMNNKQKCEAKIRELVLIKKVRGHELKIDGKGSFVEKKVRGDIHLEHVLMAVEGKWKCADDLCAVGTDGQFFQESKEGMFTHIAQFNLSKPFNEQQDSLYDLLYEILCK